ncbi:hypothetical protein, conserved [Entamoeba histolytica]
MNNTREGWEDQLFEEYFENQLKMMENMKNNNPEMKEDIDRYLEMGYITRDDNWIGSGRNDDIEINARIAAMELIRSTLI